MSETRDGSSHQNENVSGGQDDQQTQGKTTAEQVSEWAATTAARVGLVVIGLVLLLFALGHAVGVDLLGLFVGALTSETGRWLVVAFFAVVLIGVAARLGR